MPDDAITVSTETERGRRELRVLSVMIRLAGVFVIAAGFLVAFAPDAWTPQPRNLLERIVLLLFCGTIGVALIVVRLTARGSWRLNGDGIFFSPIRGRPRSMGWSEIESVRPGSAINSLVFQAGKRKIPLNLNWETPERRAAALDFLRSELAAYFDIFDRPPAKTSIRRILRASAITAAVTLLYFATLIVPSYLLRYEYWQYWMMTWGPLSFLLLYGWALTVAWREGRKTWSWRKPQSPPSL
jgi:hypothetical protein